VRGSSDRFGENVCGPEYIGDINGDYNGDGTGDVRYEDGGNVNIRYGVTNYDCA